MEPMRLSALPTLACAALLVGPLGCRFQHMDQDRSSRPETAMGTGATIMMPGESAPPMTVFGEPVGSSSSSGSSTTSSSQSGSTQSGSTQSGSTQSGSTQSGSSGSSPQAGAGSSSGAPSGSGGGDGMILIGGTEGQSDATAEDRQTPIIGPVLALFGYPFWIFGKSNEEKADQQAAERTLEPAPSPGARVPRTPDDAERLRLERENQRIREQLASRHAQPSEATGSIHDELAALERSLGSPAPTPAPPLAPGASQTLDRDRDGRPDLWAYEEPGGSTREELDDDHDGRPDRVLHYDESRQLLRTEEDLDGDGRIETVSHFKDGELVRKRTDSDGDGESDGWSFFEGGELVRHEVDRDGDGFRDLVLLYQGGELAREEEDRNRDGRPDLISHYRSGDLVEKHEDHDFDGLPDIASYYEKGRLVRRAISTEAPVDPWAPEATD